MSNIAALRHPLRMQLLEVLGDREMTVKDLATAVGVPLENVAYHVRALHGAQLLVSTGFVKRGAAAAHTYRRDRGGCQRAARALRVLAARLEEL